MTSFFPYFFLANSSVAQREELTGLAAFFKPQALNILPQMLAFRYLGR